METISTGRMISAPASDAVEGRVVWVPTNSPGTPLGELGVVFGDEVTLSVGGQA